MAIDPNKVTHVLLTDGWHKITSDYGLDFDNYIFADPRDPKHALNPDGGIGVQWEELDNKGYVVVLCVPLSSILAVRFNKIKINNPKINNPKPG